MRPPKTGLHAHDGHAEGRPELVPEEWMLVRLRDELYGGRWEEMRADLEHRLRGEPYIFKLVHRIQDDLTRIERLTRLETEQHLNLGDYLPQAGN